MIKAVVFDLDHTLFDRHGTLFALVGALRRTFRVNPDLTDEQIGNYWTYADDNYVYFGWKYIYDYLCENGVFEVVPKYSDYRTFIFENFAKVAVRFDETLPMLNKLKSKGYKIGLITNGQHALQYKKLELIGLRYIFDEIIVSGDVLTEKPDKEIFLMMTEKLGMAPKECVYVGDNPINDISGAKRAGYRTVWVKSTGTWMQKALKPDETVERIDEVPEKIEKLSEKF